MTRRVHGYWTIFREGLYRNPICFIWTGTRRSLLVIFLFNLFLTRFRRAGESTRTRLRWTLAIVLWLAESSWHIWNIAIGAWTIKTMLPLHMCSVLIWLTGFMLIFKNYSIYEFVYFLGIGGALQALLTPEAGIYGFPHFRYIQTLSAHGLLVSAGIYMTVVEGFRPTWKPILRIFVVANIYLVVIFFVNSAIGSNYLMINEKPPILLSWIYFRPDHGISPGWKS